MKEYKCNIHSVPCYNVLTDISYLHEIGGSIHLIGKCKLHGIRFLPYEPNLNIPHEKTKKLIKKENKDRQTPLL